MASLTHLAGGVKFNVYFGFRVLFEIMVGEIVVKSPYQVGHFGRLLFPGDFLQEAASAQIR